MALFRNRKRRTEVLESPEYGWIWKPLLVLLVIYLVVCLGLGIWWSQRPESFDVEQATTRQLGAPADASLTRGTRLTASLMTMLDTLLDKPGGWLRNDMLPPGLWLDNMPSWEYGVLSEVRILSKHLPALSGDDADALKSADAALHSDSGDWLYPAAEKRYSQALGALDGYLAGLARGGDGFANNGGGLANWLDAVSQRFDGLTQRLLASVDDPEALRELGVEEAALPESTSWLRIDNVFFQARGDAWALTQLLEAAQLDYADVLGQAGGDAAMERLIAELELAQRRVWSPAILNGSGFGIFANHSLVLANHTQAIAELAGQLAGRVQDVQGPASGAAAKSASTPAATKPSTKTTPKATDSDQASGKQASGSEQASTDAMGDTDIDQRESGEGSAGQQGGSGESTESSSATSNGAQPQS